MNDPSHRIFSQRRRLALGGVIAALVLLGIGLYVGTDRRSDESVNIGGPFALVDQDGRHVTDRSFRGRYMLVYFGYTFCPDVCPTTLAEIAQAMDRLGPKADHVQPIFISVDPRRDTPSTIKHYVTAFTPRLIGLTGAPDAIAQAARAYRVYYARHQDGPGADDYTMDHSSILYLMGPRGQFIAPIAADQSGSQMADEIAKFVS